MSPLTRLRMKELHLQQIDFQLKQWKAVDALRTPRGGWIKAIRTALGMRGVQLAERMSITPSTLTVLEKNEARGTITLESLAKAAEALDCDLVYVLVPREGLVKQRETQAKKTAEWLMQSVSHSMHLEAQGVEREKTSRFTSDFANDMLRNWSSMIWDTRPTMP